MLRATVSGFRCPRADYCGLRAKFYGLGFRGLGFRVFTAARFKAYKEERWAPLTAPNQVAVRQRGAR